MRAPAHVQEWSEEAKRVYMGRKEIEEKVRERIERAFTLTCERNHNVPDAYHVSGGRDPDGHTVDLQAEWKSQCTCGSHEWGEAFCKHLIRVYLSRGAFLADTWEDGIYRAGLFTRAVNVDLENAARKAAQEIAP
jgi:hypothetical protein